MISLQSSSLNINKVLFSCRCWLAGRIPVQVHLESHACRPLWIILGKTGSDSMLVSGYQYISYNTRLSYITLFNVSKNLLQYFLLIFFVSICFAFFDVGMLLICLCRPWKPQSHTFNIFMNLFLQTRQSSQCKGCLHPLKLLFITGTYISFCHSAEQV